MKKPILIFYLIVLFLLCITTQTRAQESTTDRIVLSDLKTSGSNTYFDVSLEGSRPYTAYNMDIFLPTGIALATNTSGNPRVTMLKTTAAVYPYTTDTEIDDETGEEKEVKVYTHTVSCFSPTTNQLRVACTSNVNDEFIKNSGTLFRVYVELDATQFTFSPKPIITVSGIALVQKEGAKKYVPADFSCRPFATGIPAERTLPLNISSTNKIGTLILPFDAALPTGVKAYQCMSVDTEAQSLYLTTASSITACKPYIVYAENGYSGNISGTVNLSATYPDEDIYTEGYLTGVLSPTMVNTGYIMQNQGAGPMFYDAEGENFSLPAGRCYFTPSSSVSLANVMGFRFVDAETTHISGVENGKTTPNTFYHDLSGRRVIQPTKGIYIQDGKKVLVK